MRNFFIYGLVGMLVHFSSFQASGSGPFTLMDYAQARHADDFSGLQQLRAYILGAAETHLLYSKMMRNWTGINLLCTGNGDLDIQELETLVELKILLLRRRYGNDIMSMPIAQVVQMVMEEQFKCN